MVLIRDTVIEQQPPELEEPGVSVESVSLVGSLLELVEPEVPGVPVKSVNLLGLLFELEVEDWLTVHLQCQLWVFGWKKFLNDLL